MSYLNRTIHPITTEYARKFIAENSFLGLVFYYLLLIISLSILLALFPFFSINDAGFLDSVVFTSFALMGETINNINTDSGLFFYAFRLGLKFLSILLPTALLGLIVYKLFIIPDIFVFRNKISIYEGSNRNQFLAIRFYNGTNLDLSPVEIEIYARTKMARPTGETFLKNVEIYCGTWPVSYPKVPFTVNLPLSRVDKINNEYELKWNETKVELSHNTELLMLISGNISELDKSFSEKYVLSMENVDYSKFSDIEVDYHSAPKSWNGWEKFEE